MKTVDDRLASMERMVKAILVLIAALFVLAAGFYVPTAYRWMHSDSEEERQMKEETAILERSAKTREEIAERTNAYLTESEKRMKELDRERKLRELEGK